MENFLCLLSTAKQAPWRAAKGSGDPLPEILLSGLLTYANLMCKPLLAAWLTGNCQQLSGNCQLLNRNCQQLSRNYLEIVTNWLQHVKTTGNDHCTVKSDVEPPQKRYQNSLKRHHNTR